MKRIILLLTVLATLAPSVALAGGPNSESPEPGFWLFLVIGALPILLYAWKVSDREESAVALKSQDK